MSTELIDVQMPDGTIISGVPKGITQQEVQRRYQRAQGATPPDAATLAAKKADTLAQSRSQMVPWYTGLFNRGNPSSPLSQGLSKAGELAGEARSGIPEAVTGIPGAVASTAKTVFDAIKSPVPGLNSDYQKDVVDIAQGMGRPIVTPIKQGVELLKPGLVNAPTPDAPETAQAAHAAGTMLGSAVLAGGAKLAGPTVAKAAGKAWDAIKGKLPAAADAPSVNRWMQVEPREMVHGSNPGRQVLDEGLLGSSKEATRTNVKTALADAGKNIESKLQAAGQQGIKIDAEQHVLDALADASKRYGLKTDKAFQGQLSNVLDDIAGEFPNLKDLTPAEAHALKVRIGDSIKWNGAPYEGDINQALVKMYGEINRDIKASVPGVDADMSRWGNLYQASKALKKGMVNDLAGRGTGEAAPNRYASAAKTAGKFAAKAAIGAGAVGLGIEAARDLSAP